MLHLSLHLKTHLLSRILFPFRQGGWVFLLSLGCDGTMGHGTEPLEAGKAAGSIDKIAHFVCSAFKWVCSLFSKPCRSRSGGLSMKSFQARIDKLIISLLFILLTASIFRNLEKNQILWYFSRKLCQEAVNHSPSFLCRISAPGLHNLAWKIPSGLLFPPAVLPSNSSRSHPSSPSLPATKPPAKELPAAQPWGG